MRDRRGAYGVLVRRPEGKGPLAGPRRGWANNITMGWGDMGWINLAQDWDR